VQTINPLHDPLCPLNACFDYSVGDGRAVWHTEEVIRPLQLNSLPGFTPRALAGAMMLTLELSRTHCEMSPSKSHNKTF
jgi:hypothetical protein